MDSRTSLFWTLLIQTLRYLPRCPLVTDAYPIINRTVPVILNMAKSKFRLNQTRTLDQHGWNLLLYQSHSNDSKRWRQCQHILRMPSAVLMTSRSFPHQLVRRHTPKVSGALLQISVSLGSVSSCAKLVQVMVAKDTDCSGFDAFNIIANLKVMQWTAGLCSRHK